MLVFFSLYINGCFGCLEEERIALLQLKASINYPTGSSLSSWDDSTNEFSDCCQWEHLKCDDITRRVIQLDLGVLRDHAQGNWHLNASLFLPFRELNSLDLTQNGISGRFSNEESNRLFSLQVLELEDLHVDESILQNVGTMTSLNVLTFVRCGPSGRLPAQGLCELKNLQELLLAENELEGILPSCLANMTKLRLLDLSSNHFSGSITISPISRLQSLQYLVLSNNNFSPIRLSSLFSLSKLEVILSDNNEIVDEAESQTWIPTFQLTVISLSGSSSEKSSGTILRFLRYQYKLRLIDLSHNNLLGKFPTWLLKNNSRLELLNLRNNSFSGRFYVPFHPNPNIWSIDISENYLGGPIPANLSVVFPNLEYLNISGNAFEGTIPSFFGDLVSLKTLDLSSNHFSGTMPKEIAMGCSSLKYFRLSNNNLSGQIFPTSFNLTKLSFLYINNNQFSGKIPDNLFGIRGWAFDFSNNYLSGELPRWMGNMSSLKEIAMAGNQLEGSIPRELCKLDVLKFLDLSDNKLSGSIPSCFNSTSYIRHVHLSKNRLSGPIRNVFKDVFGLITLDLRQNRLTGYFPDWIGNLSSLSILLLKENHLQGKIQNQLCLLGHLSILDLSQNNFSGPIPRCLSNIAFVESHQKSDLHNGWYGESYLALETRLPYQGAKLTSILIQHFDVLYNHPDMEAQQEVELTTERRSYRYTGTILDYMSGIDLSCNSFSGGIPAELGNLSNIRALNLSFNNLIGSIPMEFSELERIESLDLSYNNLNGIIPPQLIELNFLAVFSVAHNNLSGTIPERKDQLATFEESSYEGNPLLCGLPLDKACTNNGPPPAIPPSAMPTDHEGEEEDSFNIDMVAFYISFVVSYAMVLMAIAGILYFKPSWRRAWFYFIEVCITNFYCFVVINFCKLCNFGSTV